MKQVQRQTGTLVENVESETEAEADTKFYCR